MRIPEVRRRICATALALVCGALLLAGVVAAGRAQGGAENLILAVDAAQSKVHWTLGSSLHTVHGTFAVKSGTIRLDEASGKASGAIVVDATSGQSGNDGRDKKMHKEIIESAKYKDIIFRPDRVEGNVPATGPATVRVHGMFLLHGGEHEITVPMQADLAGDHWKGTGQFNVPYVEWGLKSPSNFFLKADPSVEVSLELVGAVQRATAAAQ
jgi:polyisoprenoid-binding protein YceI